MQQIAVTHGFVKKLARNIRDRYGRDVRHTEVIELVADALGHKAGPLMHALKNGAGEPPQSSEERLQLADTWSVAAVSKDLSAEQRKLVVLLVSKKGEFLLLTAQGYEDHPDVGTARLLLSRKGYSWNRAMAVERYLISRAYEGKTSPTLQTSSPLAEQT